MSNEINNINSIEEAEALIAGEEEKKQAVYTEIGKLYFVRHSADCEPDFKPLVDEMVEISGRIAELNLRIHALQGPTCPTCGMSVKEDSIFCTGCGTRLKEAEPVVEEPVPEQPAVIICPRCGSEMNNGMRFCSVCGCSLTEPYTPEPVQEAEPEPVPEEIPEPVQEAVAEPEAEPEPVQELIFDPIEAPEEEPVEEETAEPDYVPEPEPEPVEDEAPAAQEDPDYAAEPEAQPDDPYYAAEPAADTDSYDPSENVPRSNSYVAAAPASICPVCGGISDAGYRFCVNCGNPLFEDAPAPQQEFSLRRCPNCGFVSNDPDISACTECGTPLN